MSPPAPARFSTKQRSCRLSLRLSQSSRANRSEAPPGVDGAIMRSGRVGQSVAAAGAETAQARANARSAPAARFISLSLDRRAFGPLDDVRYAERPQVSQPPIRVTDCHPLRRALNSG